MNAENYSQFLTNPSQLHQISYQELKSLVLQYPYSQSLRFLLMRKAQMDNHEDFDKLLSLAATYSFDRDDLFKKMKSWEQKLVTEDNYLINEDYLELKDLAVLEEEMSGESSAEESEELTFSLQEIIEQEENKPPNSNKKTSVDSDNLAEDELGESLLERILKDDIQPITNETELNTADLKEMRKIEGGRNIEIKEEQIIEDSIQELKKETASEIEEAEIETSPEEWLSNAVKEMTPKEAETKIVDIEPENEFPNDSDNELVERDSMEGNPDSEENQSEVQIKNDVPLEITNEDIIITKEEVGELPKPQPKSAFNSWLQQYPHRHLGRKLDEPEELLGKKKKKKKKKEQKLKEKEVIGVAKASVIEDEEIATETLAFLLGKQGHYEKAIRMYEQLSLAMPEKSSFFAAKIENLKNQSSD